MEIRKREIIERKLNLNLFPSLVKVVVLHGPALPAFHKLYHLREDQLLEISYIQFYMKLIPPDILKHNLA